VVLPDSSVAFISSSDGNQVSAVDLRRRVLLTNIELDGTPGHLLLKPDGGELYVTVPTSHGIEIINTWTTEIVDSMLVGLAPTAGTLDSSGQALYVSDSAAGRLLPIDIFNRHLCRRSRWAAGPWPASSTPAANSSWSPIKTPTT